MYLYTGTTWWICPLLNANPDFALTSGGEDKEQRFERAGAVIKDFPTVNQALQAPLMAAVDNPDLLESRVSEYIVNSIIDGNVRETYDEWLATWMSDGGEQIIEEANAWYQTTR